MTTETPAPNSGPDTRQLLEQITTLVAALDRVVGHTTEPPPPPGDEERVRRQAIASLRYDIVSGLLGRAGVVPPFAPARRRGDSEIEFDPQLPESIASLVLRSAGPDGKARTVTSLHRDGSTTIVATGELGGAALQPIELYDANGQLVRLGPDLRAVTPGAGE